MSIAAPPKEMAPSRPETGAKSLLAWRPWPAALQLRPKLVLAFAALALLAGLCGGAGLLFVDRIGASVSVFSDVTSPLLMESRTLAENARRMRVTFLQSMTKAESADDISSQLLQLHEEGLDHLKVLRDLTTRAQIAVPLDAAEEREGEFFTTLVMMIAGYRREQAASLLAKELAAGFQRQHGQLADILRDFASRAEGIVSNNEEEAKVQVQTGQATVDGLGDLISNLLTGTYPVLQTAYKLMRENEQIDEGVKLLLVQTDPAALAAVETEAINSWKSMSVASKKLPGRIHDSQGKGELRLLQQYIGNLQTLLFGREGLFAAQRAVLEARAQVAGGQNSLERIERAYIGILSEVESAVSTLNVSARDQATSDIIQARVIIAVIVASTILAGLLFGLLFARRIAGPLMRLTEHVVHIRESGDLGGRVDAAVANRGDEIGTLSRSFDLMIAELADARSRLIASSEAELGTQYERLNAALSNMPQGFCIIGADEKLVLCNRRYAEIYELKPELTQPGTPLRTILQHRIAVGTCPLNLDDYVEQRIAGVRERAPSYSVGEFKNGRIVALTRQPMADGGSVSIHEDITERCRAEARIAYMAHHDALTDLPNRVRFREELNEALSGIDRGGAIAVLCFDLDHFKAVNDTLGHPIGDRLLRTVADRLRATVRDSEVFVSRLGGDEFAVVQVGAEQPLGSTVLSARLIEVLSAPYELEGHRVVVGTSVGIAIAPSDGGDADQLLKNADMALYRAKEEGRGRYRFFEPDMDAKMQARRALELDLRKAAALGEFEVFYQPLINLEDNEVSGFEALLRWRHPHRGLVPPARFIPLAEEIGLMGQIGAWVLKQACVEAATWPSGIAVAVNLSQIQFKSGTLVLDVIAALGASGLPARRLELEITETVLLQETEATISILEELRELGVRISMDDFGTGYSSLSYLRKFPFDKIKIDRSFINDLSEKEDSMAIVRAVTGIGSSLGITTTAEGVETADQLRRLRAEGCTEAQGFLFSEALPAADICQLLLRLNAGLHAAA